MIFQDADAQILGETPEEDVCFGLKSCGYPKRDLQSRARNALARCGLLEKKDFVIYGHSHKYEAYVQEGVQYLNPGSCGPRRFHQPVTMAVLIIEAESFHIEKMDILPRVEQEKVPELSQKDMEKLIKGILKELEKGTTVASMAKKFQVSKEFAEQVCRISVTHPGVTAHGIMDKMEVNKIVSKSGKNS